MGFEFDIMDTIKTYGIGTTIGLVLLYGLKEYFWSAVSLTWNKVFSKKKTADLNKHPAFHQMENYIAVKIPGMIFEDHGRNEVFKDMLTIMFRSYIVMMRKIIIVSFDTKGDPTFTSNDDFTQKLSQYGVQAITEYENEWRKIDVPLICITKFNEWHSNKRDILFTDIQTIANSPFHETYNEKLAAFFDLTFMVLNISILDAEYILKSLNGELSGQVYKGITIGHEEETPVIRNSDENTMKTPKGYVKRKSRIINFTEEN